MTNDAGQTQQWWVEYAGDDPDAIGEWQLWKRQDDGSPGFVAGFILRSEAENFCSLQAALETAIERAEAAERERAVPALCGKPSSTPAVRGLDGRDHCIAGPCALAAGHEGDCTPAPAETEASA